MQSMQSRSELFGVRSGSALISPVRAAIAVVLLFVCAVATAQTLARPGWAGSGMTVERWWPHAVFCDVRADSFAQKGAAGEGSTLHRLAARLDDLQTLGIDALLLRDLEIMEDPSTTHSGGRAGGPLRLDARYGTLDEFDQLVSLAVRHGMRVVVALPAALQGSRLTDEARLWLNHGATGLSMSTSDPVVIRTVRGVLRGYIGERVLIAETAERESSAEPVPTDVPSRSHAAAQRETVSAATRVDQPDLLRVSLPAPSQGAAAMRSALERARALKSARSSPIPLLSAEQHAETADVSRVVATALLGSGGAALLRAQDLDLDHAAGDAMQRSTFNWYRQWSGLHRGNATMRSGDDLLLDHDAEGALVWVRQLRSATPIVAICNVTEKPLHLSLLKDVQQLRLRGSFLRTVARSDGGMGAMPLRKIILPAFGVYVGELSR